MNRTYTRAILALSIAAVAAFVALAPAIAADEEPVEPMIIDIEVSPAILIVDGNGAMGTVHADISYDEVMSARLFLNGSEIPSWTAKEDNRGDYVAVFDLDKVKSMAALIPNASNTFLLSGYHSEDALKAVGMPFKGEQSIMVIDDDGEKPDGPKRGNGKPSGPHKNSDD